VSAVLRVEGLSKAFAGRPALSGVTLEVRAGEVTALLGPSGAGKSTLFRCVARLAEPDAGSVRVLGQEMAGLAGGDLARARRRIGLVFQQFNLVRRHTALDNVLAGRLGAVPLWRVLLRRFPGADRQAALAALDRVGLLDRAYARADTLSGGQQQRVALARALVQDCRLLLADEPVASLDPETAAGMLALLRELAAERGMAVLVSLHQVDLATGFADRILGLRDGRLVEDCAAAAFTGAARLRLFGTAERREAAD